MKDIFYVALMIVPIVVAIVLKVLFSPASEGISIAGALIYCEIPLPIQSLPITESQINSWLVLCSVAGICLFLSNGTKERPQTKRQIIAEFLVEKADNLVLQNMGERFRGFVTLVMAILALSACSSLLSLFGLFPPTSDINVVAGWAILTFALITHYKLKGGVGNYLKGFTEPIAAFTPVNFISEFATPISMSFRHYGNVLSGTVISTLVAAGLQGLSAILLGWLPGALGEFPFLRIGLPAVLSIYFDVFSGCLQAFIFAMLTMLYIVNGFPEEAYEKRLAHKNAKKEKRRAAA